MSDIQLVLLHTKAEFEEEGQIMKHALAHFYEKFAQNGVRVYSLRQDGQPLLTLSVQPDNTTHHVVGVHNKNPTPEQFELLSPLLAALGIENRYNPFTIC